MTDSINRCELKFLENRERSFVFARLVRLNDVYHIYYNTPNIRLGIKMKKLCYGNIMGS